MNSFIKYTPESLTDHKAFIEHLLSIIDTKLQFIEHQTSALISSYSPMLIFEDDNDTLSLQNSLTSDSTSSEHEEIFQLIEKYSMTTNKLLLLRTNLNRENVSRIYDLLNNDQFLVFDNNDLLGLLKKRVK